MSEEPNNYVKLRCLENHDRPRAASLFPETAALRSWTAWNYFQKGTVMLYAGQEFAVSHHPALFDQDTVCFDTGTDISPLLARLKTVKQKPIFRDASFFVSLAGISRNVIVAKLLGNRGTVCENTMALGIFPADGKPQTLSVELPDGAYQDVISGRTVDVFEQTMRCEGEPLILTDISLDH